MNPYLDANHPEHAAIRNTLKPSMLKTLWEQDKTASWIKEYPVTNWDDIVPELEYYDVQEMTNFGLILKDIMRADTAVAIATSIRRLLTGSQLYVSGMLKYTKHLVSFKDTPDKVRVYDVKKRLGEDGVVVAEGLSNELLTVTDAVRILGVSNRRADVRIFVGSTLTAEDHPAHWSMFLSASGAPQVVYKAIDGHMISTSAGGEYGRKVFRKQAFVQKEKLIPFVQSLGNTACLWSISTDADEAAVRFGLNAGVNVMSNAKRLSYMYSLHTRTSPRYVCGFFKTRMPIDELRTLLNTGANNAYRIMKESEHVTIDDVGYTSMSHFPQSLVADLPSRRLPYIQIVNGRTPLAEDVSLMKAREDSVMDAIVLNQQTGILNAILNDGAKPTVIIMSGPKGSMKTSICRDVLEEIPVDPRNGNPFMLYYDEDLPGKLLFRYGPMLEGLDDMTFDELRDISENGESVFEHEMLRIWQTLGSPTISKDLRADLLEAMCRDFGLFYSAMLYDDNRENFRRMYAKVLSLQPQLPTLVIVSAHEEIDIALSPGAQFVVSVRPPYNPEGAVVGRKRMLTQESGAIATQVMCDVTNLLLQYFYEKRSLRVSATFSIRQTGMLLRGIGRGLASP